jgi:acetate kinase
MGTRCGDLDPAIVLFLIESEGLSAAEVGRVLNRESGVLGLSEVTSDMRFFEAALREGPGHPHYDRSLLVMRHYTQRVKAYIGSYAAIMGGVDCLVFTGGIGENFTEVCDRSCAGLEFLGIEGVRAERQKGSIVEASAPDSKVKVLIVPTDEELAIARDVCDVIGGGSGQ